MVTEAYPEEPLSEYLAHYQAVDNTVAAPFIFEGMHLPWQAPHWRKFLGEFHKALDKFSPLCVPSYAFGNHDQHRLVSRRGEARARATAVMLLTLPGMAFIYNGEEIGMENGHIPADMIQDPGAVDGGGRDPERTPMQWNAKHNAGFSKAERTWLPVAKGYEIRNVAVESRDQHSFLSLYRKLGMLRKGSPTLKHGNFKLIDTGHEDVLGYTREYRGKKHVVLINFDDKPTKVKLADDVKLGKLQVSSVPHAKPKKSDDGWQHLHADEAAVFTGK